MIWKNNKPYKDLIKLDNFINAKKDIDRFVVDTPLTKLDKLSDEVNKIVYMKDESVQVTNSFKPYGVSYNINNIINNIRDNRMMNVSLVTQSTGNHGIAFMYCVHKIMEENDCPYIRSIIPIIFTSQDIQNKKLEKMTEYLQKIRNFLNDQTHGDIRNNYVDYNHSYNERVKYMNNNVSYYVAHGNLDVVIGHGTIAFGIKEQLETLGYDENTKITFVASCGAGGPIGIGTCLKKLYCHNDITFVIVQTEDQNCLIETLRNKKIMYNGNLEKNIEFNYVDGISVNKPEKEAVKIAKNVVDYGITVKHSDCILEGKKIYKETGMIMGGTSVSVYKAIKMIKNEEWFIKSDIVIMLNCEGNIDDTIINFIKN